MILKPIITDNLVGFPINVEVSKLDNIDEWCKKNCESYQGHTYSNKKMGPKTSHNQRIHLMLFFKKKQDITQVKLRFDLK